MSLVPKPPDELIVFPNRLAIDGAVATAGQWTDQLWTFRSLAQALVVGDTRPVLEPIQSMAVLRVLYGQGGDDPFLFRQRLRQLSTLREAGLTGEQITSELCSHELRELGMWLHGYENWLEENHRWDLHDVLREAVLRVLTGRVPRIFSKVQSIRMQGVGDLSGFRLDLVRAFAKRGVKVTWRAPYDAQRPEAFAFVQANVHLLEQHGDVGKTEIEFDDRVGTGLLSDLRGQVFGRTTKPVTQAPLTMGAVGSKAELARRLAEHVAHVCDADSGSVAIVLPRDESAVLMVQDALRWRGIASHRHSGQPVSGTRPSRWLINLLELSENRVTSSNVVQILEDAGPGIVPDLGLPFPKFIDVLQRAGLRTRPLTDYPDLLAGYGRKHRFMTSDDLRRGGTQLVSTLQAWSSLPDRAPMQTYVDWARTQIAVLQDPAMDMRRESQDEIPSDFFKLHVDDQATDRAAREAWDAWLARLSEIVPSGQIWALSEFSAWVRMIATTNRLMPAEWRVGSVPLLEPEDVVGVSFTHLVLGGVEVGRFPRSTRDGDGLSDVLRVEINQRFGPRLVQDAPVASREPLSGLARDRWLWLECLASASDSFALFFQEPDGERVALRSEFVDEILRVFPTVPLGSVERDDAEAAVLHRALGDGDESPFGQSVGDMVRSLFSKPISTSALDTLAHCLYQFYARHALSASPAQAESLDADPREQGSAAHAALHCVYDAMLQDGGLDKARGRPDVAMKNARATFERSVDEILEEVVVHPTLRSAALEQGWSAVAAQLKADLNPEATWDVVALEHRFDDRFEGSSDLVLTPGLADTEVRVRGSIDRIDRDEDRLFVLDYKRTVRARLPGRHLQLPVYARAGLRDFGKDVNQVTSGWIGLSDGKRHIAEDVPGAPDALAAWLDEVLGNRLERAFLGEMLADADPVSACERCDFRTICPRFSEGT